MVTVKDSEVPFLGECLDSVAAQARLDVEVLVVAYGARAASARTSAEAVSGGRALTVLADTPATLGEARNRAAAHASGTYLTFVSASDTLPRAALEPLVRSLDESGSDLARGHVVPGVGVKPSAVKRDLLNAARHVTLEEAPAALTDLFAGGVVLRRDFWRSASLSFPAGDGTTLGVGVATALVRARSFDVVAAPAYRHENRGSGKSVGAADDRGAELDDWLATQEAVDRLLPHGTSEVRSAWLAGVLGPELGDLVAQVDAMDDEHWEQLTHTVGDLAAEAPSSMWASLPVESRVRTWLIAHDRREALEEFVEVRRFARGHFDTVVEAGSVFARLPFFRDSDHAVPDAVYALADRETPLVTSLRRARWNAAHGIDLEIFVLVRGVAAAEAPYAIDLALVEEGSGRRRELTTRHGVDREVTRFSGDKFVCYDHGVVHTTIDALELLEEGADRASWRLEVTVDAQGVRRTGHVDDRDAEGSASAPQQRTILSAVVGLRPAAEGPVALSVTRARARLDTIDISGREVRGQVVVSPDLEATRVLALRGEEAVAGTVTALRKGARVSFELVLPDRAPDQADTEPGPWRLRLECGDARIPLAWPEQDSSLWRGAGPDSVLAARRTPSGNAELVDVAGAAELLGLDLSERHLTLHVRWLGVPPEGATFSLVGSRCTLHGTRAEGRLDPAPGSAGECAVEVPLTWDEWGLGETFVPLGTYRPVVTATGIGSRTLFVAPSLAERVPEQHRSEAFRLRVVRAGNRASVKLHTPLADDELGRHCQHLLRTAYATTAARLDESAVYLQSYTGHAATDSQLAIHEELRRTRPDLTAYWAVAGPATRVPEGGVPVLMHSRRWYELLGQAKYLVTNVDLERWATPRPGQLLLQTFHGYPSKAMGISMWQAKGLSPRMIAGELRRTASDWDLILTPAPEMDQHYRREYAYDGPILSHGYPRDDVFLGDRAGPLRRRTRELLGVEPGQTVVLYAPTWRDDLAARFGSSHLVQHLDLEQAAQALGDDHVLLMRGHRYHQPGASSPSSSPGIIDVTTYPEINDLLLAADVAVLDYSSIRFDFALTGRPMVFLVPDLEQYTTGSRGFLYPFEDSAPGPLLDSAAEVVEALRDLDTLRRDHAADYERFNATYNHRQDGRSAERVVRAFFGPA